MTRIYNFEGSEVSITEIFDAEIDFTEIFDYEKCFGLPENNYNNSPEYKNEKMPAQVDKGS